MENETQGKAAKRLAAFLGILPEENNTPNRSGNDSKQSGNSKPSANQKESSGNENPASETDGWQCIMPVPDNAPKPPAAHPKHGKPTRRYPYHDKNSQVNFYHDRYEKPKSEKKQFSPLTLWEKGGKYEWRFKVPSGLRPLYGLPRLLQYPDAD